MAGALSPVTSRALRADEEHSDNHIRVVVGNIQTIRFGLLWERKGGGMCAGSKGRAMWSACHMEGDHKGEGAVLGIPSTVSVTPPEHPRSKQKLSFGLFGDMPIEATDLSTNFRGRILGKNN